MHGQPIEFLGKLLCQLLDDLLFLPACFNVECEVLEIRAYTHDGLDVLGMQIRAILAMCFPGLAYNEVLECGEFLNFFSWLAQVWLRAL